MIRIFSSWSPCLRWLGHPPFQVGNRGVGITARGAQLGAGKFSWLRNTGLSRPGVRGIRREPGCPLRHISRPTVLGPPIRDMGRGRFWLNYNHHFTRTSSAPASGGFLNSRTKIRRFFNPKPSSPETYLLDTPRRMIQTQLLVSCNAEDPVQIGQESQACGRVGILA